MKAMSNWDSITASNGGGGILPEGGYAVRIDAVKDYSEDAQRPRIELVINPYLPDEGRFFYGEDAADWQRTVSISLKFDSGWQRYKMLVQCAELSDGNNGFRYQNVDGGEQQLVGKWVGMVLRHYLYTKGPRSKNPGADGTSIEIQHITTVQAIREGDFPAPETRDNRDKSAAAPAPAAPAVADYDLPF